MARDLRDRGVGGAGETIRTVAARFSVSPSYVSKVRARLRQTGKATPGPQHNHVRPRLEPYYDLLGARVAEKTDATIAELRAWMAREHGVAVSHPVMWETLRRLGLTLKKSGSARRSWICRRLPQRAAWNSVPPKLDAARLIFLDETWATTKMARSPRPCAAWGAPNGAAFLAYIEQMLCPTLHPGDIVICDNLGCQKVSGVRETIEACAAVPAAVQP